VPILPSAGKRIKEWLQRLDSTAAAERESAIARLTLLGPRTLPEVLRFVGGATRTGRLAALDLLERLAEARALPLVLALASDEDDEVARRAIEIAAGYPEPRTARALAAVLSAGSGVRRQAAVLGLAHLHFQGLVEAVDPLLGVLLDAEEDEALRLGALESLSSLDERSLAPALRALTRDPSRALARAAMALAGRLPAAKDPEPQVKPPADVPTLIARLTSPDLSSSEMKTVLDALVEQRSPAALSLLARRLEALTPEARGSGGEGLARSKARIHLALGALGSRIALHDLREMLKARPLYAARDLLAAAHPVGDASLVPALAAIAHDEPRLAGAAATAFKAIAEREKLRRTSRAIVGLRPAHRTALLALWASARATSGASRARTRKVR
jgi:HEAT repeat protein